MGAAAFELAISWLSMQPETILVFLEAKAANFPSAKFWWGLMAGILAVRPSFAEALQTYAMTHLTLRHRETIPRRRLGTDATITTRGAMTITLRPEHEKVIAQAIQSG